MQELPSLPVSEVIPDLRQVLTERHEAVLEAPPGAGKTTLIPLALLDLPSLAGKKLLMLEPRRVAAKSAASRLAYLLGEPVGKTVGYRMRLERKISSDTRLEVITEGVLNRKLQSDPALTGVGLVIFDEFHERSLDADLGLALCLQSRDIFREDPLKLLVMSATLDGQAVAQLLGDAPVLRSEGRAYPVTSHWHDHTHTTVPLLDVLTQEVGAKTLQAISEQRGNVLVFLPGRTEIERVKRYLQTRLGPEFIVCAMHGSLPLADQQRAIAPPPSGTRKVVLATNIAETSLTIEGIDTVVDSGWQREAKFDSVRGVTRLVTRRISKASAKQRAGRAGRLGPGHCYRLWSEQAHQGFAPHRRADIVEADLSALALQLLAWGIDNPDDLQWLDSPSAGAFTNALANLEMLTAAHKTGSGLWQLTSHGQLLARLSASPRLAHLLVLGAKWGCDEQAARLAGLLQTGQPPTESHVDLSIALAWLTRDGSCPASHRRWRERVLEQAKQWLRQLRQLAIAPSSSSPVGDAVLLAAAYPERIAKALAGSAGEYQLASGRRAQLKGATRLGSVAYLAVAALGGNERNSVDRIFEALVLPETHFDDDLASLVKTHDDTFYDESCDKVRGVSERRLGAIVLSNTPNRRVCPEQAAQTLLLAIKHSELALLPWTPELRQWQARVMLLRRVFNDNADVSWPDVSDSGLLATVDDWLMPALHGQTACKSLPLTALLNNLLPWPLSRELERLAPLRLEVPSGSSVAIDYSSTPPVLAVKLQEMFGVIDTPAIADGRVTLVVHLLSPARRPLQVTQDLAGFWAGSYEAVKKDMKGRYPKHPWPDDPLSAVPTAKTKRALTSS